MKNKLNAKKLTVDGVTFDSKKEYKRYCELKLLERAGEITDLKRQQRYLLIPQKKTRDGRVIERECAYIADFVYKQKNGETVVEDVKGYRGGATYAAYVIKRKLMLDRYNIIVKEI